MKWLIRIRGGRSAGGMMVMLEVSFASCGVRGEEAWKISRLCVSGIHELVKYG
jgi:hypothetical protein